MRRPVYDTLLLVCCPFATTHQGLRNLDPPYSSCFYFGLETAGGGGAVGDFTPDDLGCTQ